MLTDILHAVALNNLSDASLNYSGAYSKEVQLIKLFLQKHLSK